MTGAALGGVGLMLLPVFQSSNPSLAGAIFAVIGFGAVALGRDPNGLANLLFGLGRRLDDRFGVAVCTRIPLLGAARAAGDDGSVEVPLHRIEPGAPGSPSQQKEAPAHVAT